MILAFVSRKGGVGKTTSVVNLAAALARLGQRVLVVDLDSQASSSLSLGLKRHELVPSIYDVLMRGVPIVKAVRKTATAGLDLVCASSDLLSLDLDLAAVRHRETRLRDAIAPIAGGYDWVFLDCPPALSVAPQNAIVACDAYLVPTQPSFLAFEGIDVLVEAADRLLLRQGRHAGLLGILLTMVDYRTRSARAHVTELRLQWGLKVFDTEVPGNVRLAEAPEAGRSIFETEPKSMGAHAYRLAAVELLARTGKTPEPKVAEEPAPILQPTPVGVVN